MYNRLIEYINENKILYKYQFGFQKGKSTYMAVLTLVNKISVVNVGQAFPSFFNVFIRRTAVGPRLTTNEQKTTKIKKQGPI